MPLRMQTHDFKRLKCLETNLDDASQDGYFRELNRRENLYAFREELLNIGH